MTGYRTRAAIGGTCAGELRHWMIIEAPLYPADGAGGTGRAWAQLAEVWASVEATGGIQQARDDRAGQHVSYRIRLQWRKDLTSDMRFRLGERIFRITAVLDRDGRRRFHECLATEDVP